ncbi:hypothetical protein PHYPSEUDO_001725 [Phytophthora pseudosyringae]|uniref:Uncharacterized protein n=1 Tax=Phytophthora pseudosyringae TaxID=221518 RepID=A0A8T1VWF4_9STRA|nr:hypothetical protein PHYPSEUDO_001725 [Phytophthora pseudosyringae]
MRASSTHFWHRRALCKALELQLQSRRAVEHARSPGALGYIANLYVRACSEVTGDLVRGFFNSTISDSSYAALFLGYEKRRPGQRQEGQLLIVSGS